MAKVSQKNHKNSSATGNKTDVADNNNEKAKVKVKVEVETCRSMGVVVTCNSVAILLHVFCGGGEL